MLNKKLIALVLTAIFSLSFQPSLQATVYKWEDDNGQIHYSDQPNKPDAEKFSIRKNTTTSPRPVNTTEQDTEETTKKEAKEPAEPELVEVDFSKKEKKQFCNEAKNDIAAISSRGRMREINKNGEYVYLSEEQRQQRLSAARKKQREYCR
ncbi:MAG: DUF4124 domain-containing protein [Gammaproteobacteria bacterium]